MKHNSPRIAVDLIIFVIFAALLLLGTFIIYLGLWLNKTVLMGTLAVVMIYLLMRLESCPRKTEKKPSAKEQSKLPENPIIITYKAAAPPEAAARKPVDPNDIDALVDQMLAQGRFALLLHSQVAGNLSEAFFSRALRALEESMALVPDGDVQLDEGELSCVVAVERFFLDRYPVTNQQYYEFVCADCYQQPSLWDEGILPAVLEFVDSTDNPGPKYWKNGCYPEGAEKHPVTGVNWYEAAAYARWVGKRLPSDAEWVKAGSWPVRISSTSRVQRKYPWGDSMERTRANLWGSGPGTTVPVDQYAEGVSVGSVYQMIGNVWEWTTSNYRGSSLPQEELPQLGLKLSTALKSIRGGAFDTYFDNQASCQFQSGENPLHRRNNIGFRCAIGVCDLTLVRSPRSEELNPPAVGAIS
jgi:iron(II)-dependent oxidoreductase